MKQEIFGHRGASAYAPENTLEAFELAARMGADGVELDVQTTRDGVLVVTHDETIERVSDGEGAVKDLSLKELKALHFNRTIPEKQYEKTRIPTLEEVFDLLRGTGLKINIELKNSRTAYPGMEERVIELAAKRFALDRVIFSSFSHRSMLRVKELDAGLYCGLLYEASLIRPWTYAASLGMNAIHPHFAEVVLPGGECAEAHRAGIEVNTWTVNTEEDLRLVLAEGADRVITNFPDRALQLRDVSA